MIGGKRPGAGRPRGALNKVTAAKRAEIEASGELPLDYMLRVMRDRSEANDRRDDMAKAAARFCHPTAVVQTFEDSQGNSLVPVLNVIERIPSPNGSDDRPGAVAKAANGAKLNGH